MRPRIALLVIAFLAGCGGSHSDAKPPADQGAVWTPDRDPVIQAGQLQPFGIWNDPSVIRLPDGTLAMFLTSSSAPLFQPPVLPYRAVSNDGRHWSLSPSTPLLQATGTPFVSIETPSVVRFAGKYHLYFTGDYASGAVPPFAIGHAVSDDGIAWSYDPAGLPLIAATGTASDWDGYLVGEPGAVVVGGKLHLYFTAVGTRPSGSPPARQVIGLATSVDGYHFDAPREVLSQGPMHPASLGYVGYSTPSAVVHDGAVHLFFDVARHSGSVDWWQDSLHHAVSSDGVAFVLDQDPIFTRADFDWTTSEIRSPCPLETADGKSLVLWFAGHGDIGAVVTALTAGGTSRQFGIGYAELSSPTGLAVHRRAAASVAALILPP